MKIFLTYDYELFFGAQTGSAQKCILEPTEKLRELAKHTGVKMVFFIDCGYLKKLIEFAAIYPLVEKERDAVISQIKNLVADGHDCQLHIHPHWEDCQHNGSAWVMNTTRYKLVDFSDAEIERIVMEYQQILKQVTEKPVTVYRAGGWCLQPFERVRHSLERAGIVIDSSVFPGGKFTEGNYFYDYTNTPAKSIWRFSDDLCREDEEGIFTEYPISSLRYSAFFFWRLFLLGRMNPSEHKPLGDGFPMPSPGQRKKMLTSGMLLSASCDGYFVTKLNKVLKQNATRKYNEMVVLGHPKALTRFSIARLEKFILQNQHNHQFTTFADLMVTS